jgi:type VI secretion system protein VasG
MRVDPKSLVRRLTPSATRMLEAAVGRAASSQCPDVSVEHLLQQMLTPEDGESAGILYQFGQDRVGLLNRLAKILHRVEGRSSARPVFSEALFRWFEDAWLMASLEHGESKLRSGMLLFQMIRQPGRYTAERFPELEAISVEQLGRDLDDLLKASKEANEAAPAREAGGAPGGGDEERPMAAGDGALARFCRSLTDEVREGKVDPIFGRHREVRQMIDILCRRRKNNPIVVGEAGVGKTAMAEGLAHEIVAGRVPKSLQNTNLLSLDLGALNAGASVKGEFENRLKAVISEVKASAKPIILFIDEAHTLIGSGGSKGGSDAANLLKPALARGELRTVAATTWAEYKKYFEKDAALERRFQPVSIGEPSVPDAIVMLRGLKDLYEKAHGVRILDEAVVAAVELSDRYISGRLLPDKAVDLIDTTAARVRVEREAKPEELVELESKMEGLDREIVALKRELAENPKLAEPLAEAEAKRTELDSQRGAIVERWESEKAELAELLKARGEGEEEKKEGEGAPAPKAEGEAPAPASEEPPRVEPAPASEEPPRVEPAAAPAPAKAQRPDEDRLMHADVDADSVARTVSAFTGIPLGKMVRDTASTVLHLEDRLRERIVGQDHAIAAVAETLRAAYAGIRNPITPVGVMLFVGPSGVGKTETALALADLLYGGERFITAINMSEFQEKHTVSRLIGSPPGYVGYGEGGVLTEAVRQRPYSVVLLDECEKADLDVMNLFYQVFDKGVLNDGEGRTINFRNTMIILTSNLATDQLMEIYARDEIPSMEDVVHEIRPKLSAHFKPALLARTSVVPYRPITPETMQLIARMKLKSLSKRIEESHGFKPAFSDQLVEEISRRCTEAETGGRNVEHIMRGTLMPMIARELLAVMSTGAVPVGLEVGLAPDGNFRVDIDSEEAT